MNRFLKSPTRFIAAPAERFYHLTHSSRRTPARLVLSVPLDKLEATWSRRSKEQIDQFVNFFQESKDKLFKRSQEEHARIRNHFRGQLKSFSQEDSVLLKDFGAHQKRQEAKAEELILQNRALWNAALEEKTERMKLERKFNVLGALERIVYQAKLQKKVPPSAGIQQGLGKLAQSGEFTEILHQEVQARKLDVMHVMACVDNLYKGIADRTKRNDNISLGRIIVRINKLNDYERAALVIFLKVQDNWQNPIYWRELYMCKGGK
ncbi:hypothetical protein B9Z19DRAFT_1065127 [Tuber borchii]|uniref:Uncharacterized protein n=1 Tax=Tuber borchii TaxID=42251 RepID=A0A2T6ZS65_TUBBO|nr:hypothetical protein B9Z19DRAFT_1065127 [Tuber borchii]